MRLNERGFTLIEVMLAVVVFGFLILMVSQIMNGEIRMLNFASKQNEIEQKTRTAMVHVLDEIKLNRYTFYESDEQSVGVYYRIKDEDNDFIKNCLIYIPKGNNVDPEDLPNGTKIYYQPKDEELWYREGNTNYLIADNINNFKIHSINQLLEVYVQAKDSLSNAEYELLTWTRMY